MRKTLVVLLAAMAMTSVASAKDWNKYSRQTPKQQQQYAQFISKQEASQIALDTIWQKYQQNGYVDDVELKNKNGDAYYKVEVELPRGAEYDVYIDARTIALNAVFDRYQQQGRLDDVELKMKNGQSYYKAEVKVPSGMEFEVYVDAQTGKVTRMKMLD